MAKGKASGKPKDVTTVSAGAIICIPGKEPKILLFIQNNAFYKRAHNREVIDIGLKGKMEGEEEMIDVAKREVRQELGFSPTIDTNFKTIKNYEFDETYTTGESLHIKKSVIYFLAAISESDIKRIRLSEEHLRYEVLLLKDAGKRVKFEDDRNILSQVEEYIRAKHPS